MNLQSVAENAMKGKTGAIIAIEPRTGEILSFVSLPTYDLNLFPGGIDPESWNYLNTAETKPLLNRAMRGIYPIGSTYKPFMALAGLETGAVTPDFILNDTGVFQVGNHRFRDVTGSPKGPLNLRKSIAVSSDIYYYWLSTQIGVDGIYNFMKQWKFGAKTGIDLVGEQTGILPNREWKERRIKEPWYVGDTPSLGIGQGYNAFTLLQLAHATATLANRGVIMTPHLVKSIEDPMTGEVTRVDAEPTGKIPLKPRNIDVVTAGMTDVTTSGTARGIFRDAPYSVAGKTGTAQVVSIAQDSRYDEKKLSRELHDHALFIAFAPARNPRIALAVLVENGGFGARAAAPIAREMMDYWLTGENKIVMCLITIGFITLFSAGYSFPWRIEDQIRNLIVAAGAMFATSLIPVKWIRRVALPCFAVGCLLLLATAVAGITVKGATRWLNVGIRIQPSEIMKLAVPMMLAWYYWKRSESLAWWDHVVAFGLLLIPAIFIMRQPDLGTAILVSIAGLSVIFFGIVHGIEIPQSVICIG